MLTLDYTLSLLNLQEVIVKKVTTDDKSAVIDIEMPKKQHTCPHCCAETSYVHDYRNRLIKDIPCIRHEDHSKLQTKKICMSSLRETLCRRTSVCAEIPSNDKQISGSYI